MPAVMISDLAEPHAFTSMVQFYSRAFLCNHSLPSLQFPAREPFKSSGALSFRLSQSRIGTNLHPLPQFGTGPFLLFAAGKREQRGTSRCL